MSLSAYKARAREILVFWPPLNVLPASPTVVKSLSGSEFKSDVRAQAFKMFLLKLINERNARFRSMCYIKYTNVGVNKKKFDLLILVMIIWFSEQNVISDCAAL